MGPNNQQHNKKHTKIYDRQTGFSHLLRHPTRKWNGSILTTPEPTWGIPGKQLEQQSPEADKN